MPPFFSKKLIVYCNHLKNSKYKKIPPGTMSDADDKESESYSIDRRPDSPFSLFITHPFKNEIIAPGSQADMPSLPEHSDTRCKKRSFEIIS